MEYTGALHTAAGVYVFLMFTVFPLIVTDGYHKIFFDKFYFFWISTCVFAGVSLLLSVAGAVKAKREGGNLLPGKIHLTATDLFLLWFMLINVISTVCSEWLYEAFWGNMGRMQGLFIWIWYCAEYFLVSRFVRYRRWMTDVFLAVGMVICIWACPDTMGLDPAGWLADLTVWSDRGMFSSTIGNINCLTAVMALYLGVASILFVREGAMNGRTVFYGASLLVTFTGLIMGRSDNSVITIAVLLCFLPFYAWRDRRGFLRYWMTVVLFFTGMCVSSLLIRPTLAKPFYRYTWGILLEFASEHDLGRPVFFLPALCGVLMGLYARKNRALGRWLESPVSPVLRMVWGCLGLLAAAGGVWVLRDANHGGHPEWYSRFGNLLIFDDSWGTHRGFNWKLLMGYYKEFPLLKKLVGAGPETYGIFTRTKDFAAMEAMFGELYDVPHNEVLQYLFSNGCLGLIGYYGMIGAAAVRAFSEKMRVHPEAAACMMGMVLYTAQSVVNICSPISLPLAMLLLALSMSFHPGTARSGEGSMENGAENTAENMTRNAVQSVPESILGSTSGSGTGSSTEGGIESSTEGGN